MSEYKVRPKLAYESFGTLSSQHTDSVNALQFNPDGSRLASAGKDGYLCIWSLPDCALLHRVTAKCAVLSVQWIGPGQLLGGLADGTLLSILEKEDTLQIRGYETDSMRWPLEFISITDDQIMLATAGDESVFIWRGQKDPHSMLWDAVPGLKLPKPPTDRRSDGKPVVVTAIHWSPEPSPASVQKQLFIAYMHHGITLWSLVEDSNSLSTAVIRVWNAPSPVIMSFTLSPDFQSFITTDIEGGFNLYDYSSSVELHRFLPDDPAIGVALRSAFVHNGQAVVGSDRQGNLNLWDRFDGDCFRKLKHAGFVRAFADYYHTATDTFWIASGTTNIQGRGEIYLWRTAAYTEVGKLAPKAEHIESNVEQVKSDKVRVTLPVDRSLDRSGLSGFAYFTLPFLLGFSLAAVINLWDLQLVLSQALRWRREVDQWITDLLTV
ncbi:WD40 repeat-like protein [Sistotremastrum suecicum HHB10207 ss-3]|uniref:WD40 repeat-like protein n=1 Tax=Sistotremastrum suecicum HHB10207 ss-3 TaxID=1314776 RepID=A0A165XCX3_9AGAM|nr:WD40 repeat-like protein [Sistotremastrum suecicum HHB10207 ss-3]